MRSLAQGLARGKHDGSIVLISRRVYSSPVASVANNHKLCGLKHPITVLEYKAKIKVSAGPRSPLKALGRICSLPLPWLPAFLGLWLYRSSLQGGIFKSLSLIWLYLAFYSVCVWSKFPLPTSYKERCDAFRTHLDNPG